MAMDVFLLVTSWHLTNQILYITGSIRYIINLSIYIYKYSCLQMEVSSHTWFKCLSSTGMSSLFAFVCFHCFLILWCFLVGSVDAGPILQLKRGVGPIIYIIYNICTSPEVQHLCPYRDIHPWLYTSLSHRKSPVLVVWHWALPTWVEWQWWWPR